MTYDIRITSAVLAGLACFALSSPASAETKKSPFGFAASVGVEHDSNISVAELDTSTTQSDNALLLDLDLGYKQRLQKKLTVSADYGFSQSLHDELTQFDIQTHLFSGGLAYDFGKTDIGVKFYDVDSSLDGDEYLSLQQFSPSLSHYVTRQLFVRAAYTSAEKAFEGREERDADSESYGGDLYYFINGARHYISVGFKFKEDDAQSSAFDYESNTFKLRWVKRVPILGKNTRIKLAYSFENRDYDDPASLGNAGPGDPSREDDRQKAAFELEYPFSKNTYTSLEYEYSDYDSSLASAAYTQHLVDLRVGVKF